MDHTKEKRVMSGLHAWFLLGPWGRNHRDTERGARKWVGKPVFLAGSMAAKPEKRTDLRRKRRPVKGTVGKPEQGFRGGAYQYRGPYQGLSFLFVFEGNQGLITALKGRGEPHSHKHWETRVLSPMTERPPRNQKRTKAR